MSDKARLLLPFNSVHVGYLIHTKVEYFNGVKTNVYWTNLIKPLTEMGKQEAITSVKRYGGGGINVRNIEAEVINMETNETVFVF